MAAATTAVVTTAVDTTKAVTTAAAASGQRQPGYWQSGSGNPSLASQLWQLDSCKSGFGNLALGSGSLALAIWLF